MVPVKAPYFEGRDLLNAAGCTAYGDFMKEKVTIAGCPKLNLVDYSVKLTEILKENNINSVTLLCMEVTCSRCLEHAAAVAVANSGKTDMPLQTVTIIIDGKMK